jgi:hypothetical protein
MNRRIAIIGSFKQHNTQIQSACDIFSAAGVVITSPQGKEILEPGIPFVRFSTDNPSWDDAEIQSLAMHRILSADLVYVMSPNGYIGRTTCYEVGRIIQKGKPIYFSEHPDDLPIKVPSEFIVSIAKLLEHIINPEWQPSWVFSNAETNLGDLERGLLQGKHIDD